MPHAGASDVSTLLRRSIWFSRFILGATSLLYLRIAIEYSFDPVGSVSPQSVTLGSSDAMSILRGFGAVFFGLAFILLACLVAERRLLAGLAFLVTIATPIAAVRIMGLAIDGPVPFTFKVLPPEVLIVVLSASAFFLERRRQQALTGGTVRPDATARAPSEDE
jgi:hypothetical protein